jgi:hypothetical protein
MPTVPVDGRKQYPKLMVEIVNAMNGRDPTAGVVEQVIGDRYILDRHPPATKTSYSGGSGLAAEVPKVEEAPRSSAAARSLWPALR